MFKARPIAAKALLSLGILAMIAVGIVGCGADGYAPPAGANTSPSNLNVQVTIEEAWTGATNRPVGTTIDLTFTLVGTTQPIDLIADGTVVCQSQFVNFSPISGSYSFKTGTPPSAYVCTYIHNSNNQKATFMIPGEPAPKITSPHDGALLPANANVPIDYQAVPRTSGEVGIALLTTLATVSEVDAEFHPETGSLTFQTSRGFGCGRSDNVGEALLAITRRFRSAPLQTGFHRITVQYDVYTSILVAYGC